MFFLPTGHAHRELVLANATGLSLVQMVLWTDPGTERRFMAIPH